MNPNENTTPPEVIVGIVVIAAAFITWLGFSLIQDNWGEGDRLTQPSPMPWFVESPWAAALAVAINLLILGRVWIFFLRIEEAAKWYLEARWQETEAQL